MSQRRRKFCINRGAWWLVRQLQRLWLKLRKLLNRKSDRQVSLSTRAQRSKPPSTHIEQQTGGSHNQTIAEVRDRSTAIGSARDVYIGSKPAKAGIPFQAPPLPSPYIDRPELRQEVKAKLLSSEVSTPGTLVVSAIYGLGGIGKSVLATALAHDPEVHQRFVDGVLWVTLGQQPDILPFLSSWIQALGDYDYKPITIDAASLHLRSLLYDKQVLLVVDDAWNPDDVEPFRVGGAGCRVLVTTREAGIPDAQRYDMDVMTEQQSLQLLLSKAGCRQPKNISRQKCSPKR